MGLGELGAGSRRRWRAGFGLVGGHLAVSEGGVRLLGHQPPGLGACQGRPPPLPSGCGSVSRVSFLGLSIPGYDGSWLFHLTHSIRGIPTTGKAPCPRGSPIVLRHAVCVGGSGDGPIQHLEAPVDGDLEPTLTAPDFLPLSQRESSFLKLRVAQTDSHGQLLR